MYIPLQNVEPTNKRYLLAIDVSGSMSWGNCHGTTITPRVASAAMAMLTAHTEPQYHFVGFSHHLVPLNINSTQRLDTVVRTIEQVIVNTLFFQLLGTSRHEDGDSGGKVPKKVNLHSFCSIFTTMYSNEWFSSNRILMLCAQDFGIARGQTLPVATKNCMAWSCFSVKSSVFGHRMPNFAVILWETEVTSVIALKFQVSVWLMR